MPYARLVQLARVISQQKIEENKDKMRKQAYLGWIMYLIQPTYSKHKKIGYGKWLRDLGLLDKFDTDVGDIENVEAMKKKSLEIAEKIVAKDKKR